MIRTTFASLALTASLPAAIQVFQAFEGDGLGGWQAEGSAFGMAPVIGKTAEMQAEFTGYTADSLASSGHGGDAAKGTLTSPEFTLSEPYIAFLIGGGNEAGKTAAQLVVDGKVVREATGNGTLQMERVVWDARDFKGKTAQIRLIDDSADGLIGVDHILLTDNPNYKFPAATRAGKDYFAGLTTTDALPGASIPEGTRLQVAATYADQKITSPTAITFDDHGRVYVAETHRFREGIVDDRDHLYLYLDDLAAMKTSDRLAIHEKWKDKLPLEQLTKKSEIIRRLADPDGDGIFDESKVFAEGFNGILDGTAAGVFYYEGALYFACIPAIYQLEDTDDDGTADKRKVIQDGFGVRISLSGHDLNGFTLGPDGRVYGTVGDRGLSFVTKEGVAYDYPNEGAAFRFEPDGSNFEIFHTGLRNPKEIAFDELGNLISVDNNSDQGDSARVVYLVEGGETGWQMEHQAMHTFHREIGLSEHPTSRWMDERMWEMQNPEQPAYILPPSALLTSGPSGLTYHPGAGFLKSELGRFLVCDYRGGAANSGVWSFKMEPQGAGMRMADSRQFLWGVAATDVEYSWDGRVFVSDFITGWASHEAGRLLALDAGKDQHEANEVAGAVRIMKDGFEQRSSAELANLLRHPDMRIRLRAQLALTRKADGHEKLLAAADSADRKVRVHAIWGLGIIARRGAAVLPVSEFQDLLITSNANAAEEKLIALLEDKDAEIKAQALRALADSKTNFGNLQLGPLLADESPRVRFFAAIVAGKRKLVSYYGPVVEMLRENDNRDVYLRHAGIYALQGMAENPNLLRSLAFDDSPAVRLAAVVALRRLKSRDLARFIDDADPAVADEAIRAIVDMDLLAQRPAVAALLDDSGSREWKPFMLKRLIHNSFRLGTAEDAARVAKVAGDSKIPEVVRKEAFRLLSEWVKPFPVDQLTGHWAPLEPRDPESVRPALTAAVPQWLQETSFALTAALGLVERFDLEIPDLDPSALAKNAALPAEARATAVRLVISREPDDLREFLTEMSGDTTNEVALTALEAIAKLAPEAAIPALERAVSSEDAGRAQQTWRILGGLPGPAVDSIFVSKLGELREARGISSAAIELLDAARQREGESVVAALAAYDEALAESDDPLAKWNPTLNGGNAAAGAALFASHPAAECMRCHRADEGHAAGGETAPNLAGIAKRHPDRRYFLESMVQPSAVIAPGFGAVLVAFKNGESISGNLLAETPEHLDISMDGKSRRISRADVDSVTTPASPMPPMADVLKPAELRDLLAWLGSLDKGGAEPVSTAEPEPLNPASLETASAQPAASKAGAQQYILCGACHGQQGEGTPSGPPLAGSEWVNGAEENLIRIQLRGLVGPIQVKGQEYNIPGGMVPLAYQTDEQIAEVLTYVRSSFGNSAPPVTAASVAALRDEVGKPQLTAAELQAPEPPPAAAVTKATPDAGKYADLEPESDIFKWIAAGILLLGLAFMAQIFRKKSPHP